MCLHPSVITDAAQTICILCGAVLSDRFVCDAEDAPLPVAGGSASESLFYGRRPESPARGVPGSPGDRRRSRGGSASPRDPVTSVAREECIACLRFVAASRQLDEESDFYRAALVTVRRFFAKCGRVNPGPLATAVAAVFHSRRIHPELSGESLASIVRSVEGANLNEARKAYSAIRRAIGSPLAAGGCGQILLTYQRRIGLGVRELRAAEILLRTFGPDLRDHHTPKTVVGAAAAYVLGRDRADHIASVLSMSPLTVVEATRHLSRLVGASPPVPLA